jgi:hypothetical protein
MLGGLAMRDITRTWQGKGRRSLVTVETLHAEYGQMPRGWIRVDDITPAGLIRWAITDYDHTELDAVVGNYVDAERALLDATTCMDE